ncbi:Serine/threonine-protein kinase AfsK [Planctomycetes bacterium MalM25]|nr:Serine/threonine-protein kinase AfsK [Planctomycetes bacterium MalM25]
MSLARVFRFSSFALALVLASTAAEARLVGRQVAQEAGLTRAWFTQAALMSGVQRVAGAELQDGVLYVLSSAGTIQAFDAESGENLWTNRLGDPSQPATGPAIRRTVKQLAEGGTSVSTRCAIIVGTTIYVLDAANGVEIESQAIHGSTDSAPVLGDDHVYVSALGGRLIGYPIAKPRSVNFRIASPGQLYATPLLASGRVIWTTAKGEVYAAAAETGRPAYRFNASAPVVGTPAAVEDSLYFANERGVIYALDAERARPLWRTSVGSSVSRPVVGVGDAVFVPADGPTLHSFDRKSGDHTWIVDGPSEVVSVSPERVYAVTPVGELAVLDRKTGRPLASWPAGGALRPVTNTQTDRLFFVSESGLIQCFHESALTEPVYHGDDPAQAEPADAPAEEGEPAADTPDAPADQPAGGFDDDPFAPDGEASDDPFSPEEEAAASDDDPFSSDDGGADEDDPFADF